MEGSQLIGTLPYAYVARSMNMESDTKDELDRRRRAEGSVFRPPKESTEDLTFNDLRASPFDSAVLPVLCFAAEMWTDTAFTSKTLRTEHRALVMSSRK